MDLKRRSLLGVMLSTPFVAKLGVIMPVKKLVIPQAYVYLYTPSGVKYSWEISSAGSWQWLEKPESDPEYAKTEVMLSVLPKNSILRPGLEDFIGKKLVC